MACEKLDKCPFYLEKMPIDSGLGKIYRTNYCLAEKGKCARYVVSVKLGPDRVPVDLYPNMHDQAQKIIADRPR